MVIKMVITLSGVTGVGKSYFKKEIQKRLEINQQVIITTRKKREDEIEGVDKIFVSDQEFERLKEQGDIIVTFEFLGNKYGYSTKDMQAIDNSIVELHYSIIYQLKKEVKNTFSIYMIPKDIEIAKEQLRKRNLPKEIEKCRLKEIEDHMNNFIENQELRNQFDYILYNDYTQKSVEKVIEVIKKNCIKEIVLNQ